MQTRNAFIAQELLLEEHEVLVLCKAENAYMEQVNAARAAQSPNPLPPIAYTPIDVSNSAAYAEYTKDALETAVQKAPANNKNGSDVIKDLMRTRYGLAPNFDPDTTKIDKELSASPLYVFLKKRYRAEFKHEGKKRKIEKIKRPWYKKLADAASVFMKGLESADDIFSILLNGNLLQNFSMLMLVPILASIYFFVHAYNGATGCYEAYQAYRKNKNLPDKQRNHNLVKMFVGGLKCIFGLAAGVSIAALLITSVLVVPVAIITSAILLAANSIADYVKNRVIYNSHKKNKNNIEKELEISRTSQLNFKPNSNNNVNTELNHFAELKHAKNTQKQALKTSRKKTLSAKRNKEFSAFTMATSALTITGAIIGAVMFFVALNVATAGTFGLVAMGFGIGGFILGVSAGIFQTVDKYNDNKPSTFIRNKVMALFGKKPPQPKPQTVNPNNSWSKIREMIGLNNAQPVVQQNAGVVLQPSVVNPQPQPAVTVPQPIGAQQPVPVNNIPSPPPLPPVFIPKPFTKKQNASAVVVQQLAPSNNIPPPPPPPPNKKKAVIPPPPPPPSKKSGVQQPAPGNNIPQQPGPIVLPQPNRANFFNNKLTRSSSSSTISTQSVVVNSPTAGAVNNNSPKTRSNSFSAGKGKGVI